MQPCLSRYLATVRCLTVFAILSLQPQGARGIARCHALLLDAWHVWLLLYIKQAIVPAVHSSAGINQSFSCAVDQETRGRLGKPFRSEKNGKQLRLQPSGSANRPLWLQMPRTSSVLAVVCWGLAYGLAWGAAVVCPCLGGSANRQTNPQVHPGSDP